MFARLFKTGGSKAITLPPATLAWLGIEDEEELVFVCEESQKYGHYLGLGKPKEANKK